MAVLDPKAWVNLEKARLLLFDDHVEDTNILIQLIRAFGVKQFVVSTTQAEAEHHVADGELHLILVNANLKTSNAYDFVNWLRRTESPPNCYAPVVLIAGHTPRSNVERARDCGANVVMAKPVSPASVLERILWTAREKRPIVKCSTYVGPDRRFRRDPLTASTPRRRHDDAPYAAPDEAPDISEAPQWQRGAQ